MEITTRDEDLFAVRIFEFSQTFTASEEAPEDSAGFDRALIARHLSLLISKSNLNLLDCQTESGNIRLLVRIP